jgi:hypothetical protein
MLKSERLMGRLPPNKPVYHHIENSVCRRFIPLEYVFNCVLRARVKFPINVREMTRRKDWVHRPGWRTAKDESSKPNVLALRDESPELVQSLLIQVG